jgi:polysaccharide deacetylase family protein (PEP-CTERM system associated)
MVVKNIISIDVEEIFHAEYVRSALKGNYGTDYKTIYNIPNILELLKEFEVSATFFLPGEIVQKFPEILGMISSEGHESAFHGWSHTPLWEQDAETFRLELEKFLKICPECIGYRAPCFSMDNSTKWALEVLQNAGIKYDSSVFPVKTPLYGVQGAPVYPYRPHKMNIIEEDDSGESIIEFPLLTYSFLGLRIPAAGGFYLRLMPGLIHKSIRRMNAKGLPAVIYVHSWEIDSETYKYKLGPYRSFVTYHNLFKTIDLLRELFRNFQFTCFREFLIHNNF